MFKVGLAALSLFNLAARPCVAADTIPDPVLTPGSVRVGTPAEICGRAREARHRMTRARANEVLRRYELPSGDHPSLEIDHLIPLCIGGSDDLSNLWPEPRRSIEPVWNAERKDQLEHRLCAVACAGEISLADAQLVFTADWREGWRVYVGGERR